MQAMHPGGSHRENQVTVSLGTGLPSSLLPGGYCARVAIPPHVEVDRRLRATSLSLAAPPRLASVPPLLGKIERSPQPLDRGGRSLPASTTARPATSPGQPSILLRLLLDRDIRLIGNEEHRQALHDGLRIGV